jgi:hypothetical protein
VSKARQFGEALRGTAGHEVEEEVLRNAHTRNASPQLPGPPPPHTIDPGDHPDPITPLSGVRPSRESTDLLGQLPAPEPTVPRTDPGSGNAADVVHCSLFAPSRVPQARVFLVQVIAHLPDHAEMARRIAVEHDLTASSRGVAHLTVEVPKGAMLGFELRMRELEIVEENVATIVWRGQPTPVTFEVLVPETQRLGPTTGRLLVRWDGLTIGDVRFQVEVLETGATYDPFAMVPAGLSAQRFEQAFVSYASSDRLEVLKRVQALRQAGIRCFQDVLDLEPGQRWERELYRKIDESDLFYLFWSRAARDSAWVRKELEYALRCNGGDDDGRPLIQPIPLESPTTAAPPPELSHLHFDDAILQYIEAQAARRAGSQTGSSNSA